MTEVLHFGKRELRMELSYRPRKTMAIRVHPDGRVEVWVPDTVTREKALAKLRVKAPWIVRQLDDFEQFRPGITARQYVAGETHLYLGKQYRLKLQLGEASGVKAYRGQLWVSATNGDPTAIQQRIEAWYLVRAREVFASLLEEVLPKFRRYGINQPRLRIRKMQKRWGSCTAGGAVVLNTELIRAPKSCIEYVLVHELCHLVHHNHGVAFYRLLGRLLPDWEKRKVRLERLMA